jgi:hypothetical protein
LHGEGEFTDLFTTHSGLAFAGPEWLGFRPKMESFETQRRDMPMFAATERRHGEKKPAK